MGSCDRSQMVSFLQQFPERAAAWRDALNGDLLLRWSKGTAIGVDQIGSYVGELTPVLLRIDTRVTNHGFLSGAATSRQSVLQAGTAVLVDQYGIPRVRCACGNPLTPPQAVATDVSYTGGPWPGFDSANLVRVQQSIRIINTFVLTDVRTGAGFGRPGGSDGGQDTPLEPSPPTSTTMPAPATTAPPPANETPPVPQLDPTAVKLSTDGLGVVDFGDDAEQVVTTVSAVLGEPDYFGDWTEMYCSGEGGGRLVVWGDLAVILASDVLIDGQPPLLDRDFWGYQYGGTFYDPASQREVAAVRQLGLRTPSGIGVGSTGSDVVRAYGDRVMFSPGDPTDFPPPYYAFSTATDMFALYMELDTNDERLGRVIKVSAGGGCGE